MRKIFIILLFIWAGFAFSAFAEEVEIESEIISVDPQLDFFIIKGGANDGIEIGDAFLIHRYSEKIAEAYIIEARPTVSAAEILSVEEGKEIDVGDSILLVKQTGEEGAYLASPEIFEEGDIITTGIDNTPETVFSYSRLVLQENGYLITSSNRAAGLMLAKKPIALSLLKELWADAIAAIDHNLVLSIEIKGEGDSTTLMLSSFKEHSQKERYIKRAVAKDSKYYQELLGLVSEVKKRSEY